MDIHDPTRFLPRKSLFPNRFLSANPHASQPSESSAAADLSEDDIFATDISEHADHRHNHLNNNSNSSNKKTNFSENFGILAALPESRTHCYHKSSSSRAIPGIPKPPPQQQQERSPFGKLQYQSAPVNVPVMARAMRNRRKFDDVDENDDKEADTEMLLPPHEIVARSNTPVVACSVLEGVGRTLKGRDQRQVRNAVLRRTGFLD